MKRFLFSTLAILVSLGTLAATAQATQVGLNNEAADIDSDGEVTLDEVHLYNRDQREGYHKNGTLAATVQVEQLGLNDDAADINGDGEVTLNERHLYNRDQRD